MLRKPVVLGSLALAAALTPAHAGLEGAFPIDLRQTLLDVRARLRRLRRHALDLLPDALRHPGAGQLGTVLPTWIHPADEEFANLECRELRRRRSYFGGALRLGSSAGFT